MPREAQRSGRDSMREPSKPWRNSKGRTTNTPKGKHKLGAGKRTADKIAWGLLGRKILHGLLNRSRPIIEKSY
jgi:hypothetical protein